MSHKIRLGPIAVFLAVITAVLATLAILTVSTARADAVLAERFAQVTKLRYELEAEGSRFLAEADALFAADGETGDADLPEGAALAEDGSLSYYIEKEGYAMTVRVAEDAGGGLDIREWKISKLWEGDDPFEDIWPG